MSDDDDTVLHSDAVGDLRAPDHFDVTPEAATAAGPARLAVDDPATLARMARIVRIALARGVARRSAEAAAPYAPR